MRLERLFTHRLIRALRLLLPIVVVVLVAIPAWNYWTKLKQQSGAPPKPIQLPKDLAIRTDNFSYSRTEAGGRTLFTIQAKTNLVFVDERNMLQDVSVTIFGKKDSEPARTVKSKECSYEQKTDNIICNGNVELQLDEHTHARTEELTYNHTDRRITAPKSIDFERPGLTMGQAKTLDYSMSSGVLKLGGPVKLRTTEGIQLESGSAVFHENENWVTASDGVLVSSPSGWIRGLQARADLTPDTLLPKTVVVEGEVSSESRPVAGGDSWKLQAGWLQARMSAKGSTEHVLAKTQVVLQQLARDGTRVLSGGEVEATLTAAGKVEAVEARGDAQMAFGADRTLRSNRIWSNASGGVETDDSTDRDRSILTVGDYSVTGRTFSIQSGDIVTFRTAHRATLTAGARESSADKTDAQFDSRTNQLIKLTQTGRFQFKDGVQSGQSDRATLEENATVITLEGAAKVSDSKTQIEAGLIHLNENLKRRVATGNVRSVIRDASEQVLVLADRADGTADRITYAGKVRLFRGEVSIETDQLEMAGSANTFQAVAIGHVVSNLNNVRVRADKLDYDEKTRVANYSGSVNARKQDLNVQSETLMVKGDDRSKTLSEMTAKGKVVVSRGSNRGSGNEVYYVAGKEQMILSGAPAELSDGKGNTTRGPRIIVNVSGDKMAIVESGDQKAVTTYKTVPPL